MLYPAQRLRAAVRARDKGRDAGPDAAQNSGRDRVQLGREVHEGAQSREDRCRLRHRLRGPDALRLGGPAFPCYTYIHT